MVVDVGLITQLQDVLDHCEEEFNGNAAQTRLGQLRTAIKTAQMAVQYLYDEAERMEGYRE